MKKSATDKTRGKTRGIRLSQSMRAAILASVLAACTTENGVATVTTAKTVSIRPDGGKLQTATFALG